MAIEIVDLSIEKNAIFSIAILAQPEGHVIVLFFQVRENLKHVLW